MIDARVVGVLLGAPISNGAGRVSAQVHAMSHDGLPVEVTVLAYGEAGATLLRFAKDDRVEVSGPIAPRVFTDRADNHFVRFDLLAKVVKRVRRGSAA